MANHPLPQPLQKICLSYANLILVTCCLYIEFFYIFFILCLQERFTCKDQKISENFYVRGDGTVSSSLVYMMCLVSWVSHLFMYNFIVIIFSFQRAFYFSNEFLTSLFEENGFHVEELGLCCKQVENRSRELVMNR